MGRCEDNITLMFTGWDQPPEEGWVSIQLGPTAQKEDSRFPSYFIPTWLHQHVPTALVSLLQNPSFLHYLYQRFKVSHRSYNLNQDQCQQKGRKCQALLAIKRAFPMIPEIQSLGCGFFSPSSVSKPKNVPVNLYHYSNRFKTRLVRKSYFFFSKLLNLLKTIWW